MSKESEAIKRIMDGLKCSEKEAREVYAADVAIDHGEKMEFDLPKEKADVARKFAHTGTRKAPPAYKFDKRPRKENPTKAGIIAEIAKFLQETSENAVKNLEITNKERQIRFTIGENTYELTLVQKRKPK